MLLFLTERMFDTLEMGCDTYPDSMPDPKKREQTPFERFQEAARRLFQVPKTHVERAELRERKEREAREGEKQP